MSSQQKLTPSTQSPPASTQGPPPLSGFQSRVSAVLPKSVEEISKSLFVYHDCCNVYIIRSGRSTLLIDFGSGNILNLLGNLDIAKPDWILHTHHHRDQCQGDVSAKKHGIAIAVPKHERFYFEHAHDFWQNRRVFDQYDVTNDFFTLAESVTVDLSLEDFAKFRWKEFEFEILPSPGHTPGSISLLARIDGRKVAFTGDLIHSPGKTLTLYDLQYNYASSDGVDCAISSLSALLQREPDLVCPSHGDPMRTPASAIAELKDKLTDFVAIYTGQTARLTVSNQLIPLPPHSLHHLRDRGTIPDNGYQVQPVSPHLIASASTLSSFYTILSNSGKALMIDFGCASGNFFVTFVNATKPGDRLRFVPHSLPELQSKYGLKSIDVIMPSHVHDDHIAGFPYLKQNYGAKVYCYENMKEVLEHPSDRNLGCLLGEPIKVDRALAHRESFRWEEYEFVVLHNPGHTEYQMALVGTIDGVRMAFTGDAFLHGRDRIRHNVIFRNQVQTDSHLKSVLNVMEESPEILAPGHGVPFRVTQKEFEALRQRMQTQAEILADMTGGDHPDFGLDPSWIRLSPYLLKVVKARPSRLELIVHNYAASSMEVESTLHVPAGWEFRPRTARFRISPEKIGKTAFTLLIPAQFDSWNGRTPITADVAINGEHRGQLAEAVVEIKQ